MSLTDPQIRQEAMRVLRRLAGPRMILAQIAGDPALFGVFSSRNKWTRPVLKTDAAFAEAFLAREWLSHAPADHPGALAGEGSRYVLSDVGEAFVKRASAGAEDDAYMDQHRINAQRPVDPKTPRGRMVTANLAESPLGWLRHRKGGDGKALITQAEFEAGERLREDFTIAGLTARVTADWSLAPGTAPKRGGAQAGQLALTDAKLAARQRFAKAVKAVGPGLSDVLIAVCCHLTGLEDTERDLGWPKRSGKVVLKIALARLADHYGLTPREGRSGRLRHWRQG